MTITNGYCTMVEWKARYFPVGASDSYDDSSIESVIESVSRLIDEHTGRHFYTAAETRYYTAVDPTELIIDDLTSVTTLKTDDDGDRTYENTWSATDYDLEPYNASTDGKPYTRIHVSPRGNYSFPYTRKGVQLVGAFGWAAVPKLAKEACLLQAFRIFQRKGAPFGVAGSAELGQLMVITSLDPDVKLMLDKLQRGDSPDV